ncbi:hypothetical protein KIL84_009253 [Mauremys mutica]|uniref:Uncharacterized protein n=1 Tax=Mauremys mutica TaxID=74926 RepID=A0A9D4AXS8_9SAUR|nr:hypothetical protein KIL84_009253 [Mauremys mutica]
MSSEAMKCLAWPRYTDVSPASERVRGLALVSLPLSLGRQQPHITRDCPEACSSVRQGTSRPVTIPMYRKLREEAWNWQKLPLLEISLESNMGFFGSAEARAESQRSLENVCAVLHNRLLGKSSKIVNRRKKQQGDRPKDSDNNMTLGQYPGSQHHQTVENFGETK